MCEWVCGSSRGGFCFFTFLIYCPLFFCVLFDPIKANKTYFANGAAGISWFWKMIFRQSTSTRRPSLRQHQHAWNVCAWIGFYVHFTVFTVRVGHRFIRTSLNCRFIFFFSSFFVRFLLSHPGEWETPKMYTYATNILLGSLCAVVIFSCFFFCRCRCLQHFQRNYENEPEHVCVVCAWPMYLMIFVLVCY